MDSIIIKQEPKYEEDFEDFFCEEEMKVCSVAILKYYCDYYYYIVLYIVVMVRIFAFANIRIVPHPVAGF